MKFVSITKSKRATVDDEDFERISSHNWYAHSGGYAARQIGTYSLGTRKQVYMHQEVLGGKLVDHINGDKLDNRKANLRFASKRLNAVNTKLHSSNKSGYRGVCWSPEKKRWHAYVHIDNKRKHLGYYKEITEAIKARDMIAKELWGEFAVLNFKEAIR